MSFEFHNASLKVRDFSTRIYQMHLMTTMMAMMKWNPLVKVDLLD